MKKISIIIMILVLSWCSWNYKNWDIQENIDAKTAEEIQDELDQLEQQKIKETLAKIELENEIASEVLDSFLNSDNFDVKAEIKKTKEKYNDSLGPILEYEHEEIQEEEKEINLETLTWSTLSWIWVTDNCSGGLEMLDLEQNKKWLFENSCEQIIYDFELAVWGINVHYNTADWSENTQFVSIK